MTGQRSRLVGLAIAGAGITFSLLTAAAAWRRVGQPWLSRQPADETAMADLFGPLSSADLLLLAGVGLMVLLFSRTVPRWWPPAYALFALVLLSAIIWRESEAAAEFLDRVRRDPDSLFTGATPRLVDYVVIALRLVLCVVASLALAAPLILPARLRRRPPHVPTQPLGL